MQGSVYVNPIKLVKQQAITAGATASDVSIGGRSFIIQNTHASQIIYFTNKDANGAATATTGLKIAAGEVFPYPVEIEGTMSIIGSGAGTTGIVTFLE
jgi:hypothetical protein